MQQINITSRVKYKTGYVQPLNILWDCVKLKFCRKITVMFWITFEKIIDLCKIDVFSFLIRIQTAVVLQTLVVIGGFEFLLQNYYVTYFNLSYFFHSKHANWGLKETITMTFCETTPQKSYLCTLFSTYSFYAPFSLLTHSVYNSLLMRNQVQLDFFSK